MSASNPLAWRSLVPAAQLYVAAVIAAGAVLFVMMFPTTFPQPTLFALLLVVACVTSTFKVTLPITVAGESTLSVSYAADLLTLLLLGPGPALVVAVAGAWAQCTLRIKGRYPVYRTVFSVSAEAITMTATGFAYGWLGGAQAPVDLDAVLKPLVGAIATYFVCNTGLVATAIALSTRQKVWDVWRNDFLWSSASFMVAGGAGAAAAVIIARGQHWRALVMLAPVYLTYWTYQVFTGRLEDRRRHAQELALEKQREKAARDAAEQANHVKDEFLAVVSHELRTPLTAIVGWAEMLRTGKLENGRRQRACQVIYDSARRQAAMIDELLDVARIVSGKLRIERAAFDLNVVVRDAIGVVQPAAEAKRIRIVNQPDPSIGTCSGDAARLQQVAWNLLSNAVKFTPEGGTVRVGLRRDEGAAELTVSDNGPGIDPAFLPAIFEAFRQVDGSTTRAHGGLGLGLSIVKHIVEAHGGTVAAESAGAGRGATFRIRLPIVPLPAFSSYRHPFVESTQAALTLAGLSVLVVDDDEASRQVIAAYLEDHHARVLTAASAAEAMDLLERDRVNVLLADIAMPGEDGYTLLRKVRASNGPHIASVPAAAITALARDEDRQQALQAGFQLHLAKPIDTRSLVSAVASLGFVSAG